MESCKHCWNFLDRVYGDCPDLFNLNNRRENNFGGYRVDSKTRVKAYVNASPLIYLGQIGKITLLKELFSETITSNLVVNEIKKKKDAPELVVIEQALEDWLLIKDVRKTAIMKSLLATDSIHEGEASIIALALETPKIEQKVILDDYLARQVAISLNLKVIGTVGVLLLAVKQEIISKKDFLNSFKALCEQTSYRISVKLYNTVLAEINES